MDALPSDQQLRFAAYVGSRFAIKSPLVTYCDIEDYRQEAMLALLVEWPKLLARYPDGPTRSTIMVVVWRRCVDALRTQTGWRRTVPAPPIFSLDAANSDPAGTDDTEATALVDIDVERWIEFAALRGADGTRTRLRRILRRLTEGASLQTIGAELGVTESRISQILSDLRSRLVA